MVMPYDGGNIDLLFIHMVRIHSTQVKLGKSEKNLEILEENLESCEKFLGKSKNSTKTIATKTFVHSFSTFDTTAMFGS